LSFLRQRLSQHPFTTGRLMPLWQLNWSTLTSIYILHSTPEHSSHYSCVVRPDSRVTWRARCAEGSVDDTTACKYITLCIAGVPLGMCSSHDFWLVICPVGFPSSCSPGAPDGMSDASEHDDCWKLSVKGHQRNVSFSLYLSRAWACLWSVRTHMVSTGSPHQVALFPRPHLQSTAAHALAGHDCPCALAHTLLTYICTQPRKCTAWVHARTKAAGRTASKLRDHMQSRLG